MAGRRRSQGKHLTSVEAGRSFVFNAIGGLVAVALLLVGSILLARELRSPATPVAGSSSHSQVSGGVAATKVQATTPPQSNSPSIAAATPGARLSAPARPIPSVPAVGQVPVFGVANPVWPAAPYVTNPVVRVTVSSTHPQAGSPIVVTISGVAPGEVIQVVIYNDGETFPMGALHADARGADGQSFTVPLVAGVSELRVFDPAVGASSSIAMSVVAQFASTAPSGAVSLNAAASGSAPTSSPVEEPASSGGVEGTDLAAGDQSSLRPTGWGWSDTGVAGIAMLVFGLPIGGVALIFLGRHSRPYRRR